jgi:uncharacterized protein YgiM (DUF1202 family)
MPRRIILFLLVTLLLSGLLITSWSVSLAQDFGTNWAATFYNTNNLSGSGVPVAGINGLNFNWGTGVPIVNGAAVPGIGSDNFSARFTSLQNFQAATYTFSIRSDDGVRLYIDGQLVIDQFVGRLADPPLTAQRAMTVGQHTLTVEYFEGVDQAILQVSWTASGVVPPPVPAGAIAATIIRAPVLNVRSAPSVFSERVSTVRRGQTYQVVGRDENARWFLIQLSSGQGWVLGYYVSINTNEFNAPVVSPYILEGNPSAISGVVARSEATLRLRSAPTVNADQIGRVTWGGALAVTGRTRGGDWYQVVWKGTTGWVASAWVEVVEGDINSVPVLQ